MTDQEQVIVYTGPECGKTDQMEKFLDNHGFTYTVVNLTGKPDMIEKICKKAEGKRTAPIIAIGDEVLAGSEPHELEQVL
jgi:glutaredoxin